MAREITHRYDDPVDVIWLETARRLGMRVVRSDEVFASWDGAGTLTLSTAEHLDPDDCLAQMILHEICHALVQGPDGWTQPDFGLDNLGAPDSTREHACHRVQAALADTQGLRRMLAVTTDHRPHWDALSADPLTGAEEAASLARAAWKRGTEGPWASAIAAALQATATIDRAVAGFAQDDQSLWHRPSLHRGRRGGSEPR